MPPRPNRRPAKKSGKSLFDGFSLLKAFKGTFFALICFVAGGLLFNLDRMGDFGITLLKHKEFFPSSVRKFLPGGTASEGTAAPMQEFSGQVIEVYDGDTITVLTPENKKYRVRFFGIDAPEAAQEHGIPSRDALREKILARNVSVKVMSVDRYQRSVGKIMLDSRYINKEMVSEGLAWYYSNYARREYDLADAERYARQHKSGIWNTSNPTPPWEWRKKNK